MSFYPPLDVSDPKIFVAGIVSVFTQYPAEVLAGAVTPTGIPQRVKYLRSLAEIREICEELYAPILRQRERGEVAAALRLPAPGPRTPEQQAAVDAQVAAWFGRRANCTA